MDSGPRLESRSMRGDRTTRCRRNVVSTGGGTVRVNLFSQRFSIQFSPTHPSRVLVFPLFGIHFNAHMFLSVGDFLERPNVIGRLLLQSFVPSYHHGSSQQIALY